jgi:hypothetical protein
VYVRASSIFRPILPSTFERLKTIKNNPAPISSILIYIFISSSNTSSSTSTISLFQRSSKEIESAESLAMATTTPSSETNGNLNGIGAIKNGHISDEEEQQQQQVIPTENGQAVTNGYHHQQNGYASRLRNAYVNGKSHEKKEEIAAKIMVMNGGHVANGMIMNGHGANGVTTHPKGKLLKRYKYNIFNNT